MLLEELCFRQVGCTGTCVSIMFCCWKSCANTVYAIPSSLQTSWPPRYLCAWILVGLKCWKFCCWKSCANTLYAIPSSLQTSWLHRYLVCVSVGLMCWERFVNTLYVSTIFPSDKLAAQVLVCLSVVSRVGSLRMLDAQVPVCLSVGLKCWMLCCWKSCAGTLYAITSSFQTIWPPRYFCACLLVGLKCWKFCCWKSCSNTLYAIPSSLQKCWLHRYLVCVSVGLMCWERFVNTLYNLPFRQVGCTGTCVPIGWVEVLDVLLLEELC